MEVIVVSESFDVQHHFDPKYHSNLGVRNMV
jgi:hypothetical protein